MAHRAGTFLKHAEMVIAPKAQVAANAFLEYGFRGTILNHQEFKTFAVQSLVPFKQWCERAQLKAIQLSEKPKAIIHRISEDLLESDNQALQTYLEENCSESGLLEEALNDKDKVTKATVTTRLKLATDTNEQTALKHALKLFDAEARAKKVLKPLPVITQSVAELSGKVASHLKAMGLEL